MLHFAICKEWAVKVNRELGVAFVSLIIDWVPKESHVKGHLNN